MDVVIHRTRDGAIQRFGNSILIHRLFVRQEWLNPARTLCHRPVGNFSVLNVEQEFSAVLMCVGIAATGPTETAQRILTDMVM